MANLSNINNKFLVTTGGNVLIGQTADAGKKLYVYNTASADVALLESTQVFSTLAFKSSTNASTVTIGIDGAGNAAFENKLAAGNMTFVTNGAERIRIDSAGNVGIGTASPACILNIEDSVASTAPATDANNLLLIENTNAAGSCNIRLRGGDGATRIMYGHNVTGDDKLYITPRANDNPVIFDGSGNVEVSGNITIHDSSNAPYIDFVESGATSDSKARITMDQVDTNNGQLIFSTENAGTLTTALTINQTQDATFAGKVSLPDNKYLSWTGSNTRMIGNSDYLIFQVAASDKMAILSGGNVGIGTTSPDEILHLYNASAGDTALKIETTSGGDPTIYMTSQAASRQGIISFQDNDINAGRIIYEHATDIMTFYTGGTGASHLELTLQETAGAVFRTKVGIGTGDPYSILEVTAPTTKTNLGVQYLIKQ